MERKFLIANFRPYQYSSEDYIVDLRRAPDPQSQAPGRPSSFRSLPWYKKVLNILGLLFFSSGLIYVVFDAGHWKKGIEVDFKELKDATTILKEKVLKIEDITFQILQNKNPGERKYVSGLSGLMKPDYQDDEKTSFGVPYHTNYNICEYNEQYDNLKDLGTNLALGHFIEIINDVNNLKTWAMVVGKFSDKKNRNRCLVLSRKTASELVLNEIKGNFSIKISVLTKKEWETNKACIYLYKDIYKLD